ncbi:MAG TPA: NAD(P)-dependent alcohol dehydrogenase [Steroidobacteraceae bacterium]|nr:NAD(P)-dependent alcohol dehydrogenase [Steroidobacteraceae bacterium]
MLKTLSGSIALFLFTVLAGVAHAVEQLPTTARKIVLEKAETGYRWKLVTAPVPQPGARQVLVRVHAVGLNRGDWEVLGSNNSSGALVGRIPGSDAAGEVVAVGKNVKGFRPGARVTSLYFRNWTDGTASKEVLNAAHGFDVDGVLGEYVVLEDTAIVAAPKSLAYEEAATLPTAGLTAWNATVGKNELRDRVVLVQGTGGVSIFALQFANAAKARVIATSSSDEKLATVRGLGARDGINYRTHPNWSEQVMALTGGHGADLVVDVGGKETLEQSVKSLAYGGLLSIVGGLSGYDGSISSLGLLNKTASARGVFVGSRADYQRMSAFIDQHRLHPVIDKVFTLDEFAAALQHLRTGNPVGRVVLKLVD